MTLKWMICIGSILAAGCRGMSAPPKAMVRETAVTASAELADHPAFNAIDGGDASWKAPDGEQTLTLDLGYPVPIRFVTLDWSRFCAADFDILLSMDGSEFEVVLSETGFEVPNVRRTFFRQPGKRQYDLEEPKTARFLRLHLKKAALPRQGYELLELRVNKDVPICYAPVPESALCRNPSAAPSDRLNDLLDRMTFREKVYFTGGFNKFLFPGLSRFGLKPVLLNDTTAGVVLRDVDKKIAGALLDQSTGFPTAAALAATWNPSLASEMAGAIGEECRAHGTGVLLGPGMNIHRTSICGRNFEYFSEDPMLTASMVVPYIQAIQQKGIVATAKHLIANNNEFLRFQSNALIDERTLHEIYLPAFKAAVQDGGVLAVMSAYNWLNGSKCGEDHYLLTELLREELGFDGMVMSDWGGNDDRTVAPGSGQNIIMPHKQNLMGYLMAKFAEEPEQTEALVEEMITPTLRVLFESGIWDRPVGGEPEFLKTLSGHKAVARKVASEAITVLKNDGVLPLQANTSLLVTGTEKAVLESSSGMGSGNVKGYDHVTYLDGLRARFSAVSFSETPDDDAVRAAGCVLFFIEMGDRENEDRPFELPEETVARIRRMADLNNQVVVIASTGTAFEMDWIDDVEGLVHCYFLGQERGNALGDVLSGAVNPSGKLPFSMEKKFADSPAYGENIINGEAIWKGRDPRFTEKVYDVPYDEGVFVGYRWYEAENKPVHFPFGFGLSYTSFEIQNAMASSKVIKKGRPLRITVTVKNTGSVAGAETVQCYVHDETARVPRPYRELKAFQKVFLQPNETKQIDLILEWEDFAFWDEQIHAWVVEPGAFELLIGNSSRNVQKTVRVEAK